MMNVIVTTDTHYKNTLNNDVIYWRYDKNSNKRRDGNYDLMITALQTTFSAYVYRYWNGYDIKEMTSWCSDNISGNHGFTGKNTWAFENEDDALNFSLRWA